ncbi:MAG: hypothetical protein C4315_01780 [Chloroflexota bacterium]
MFQRGPSGEVGERFIERGGLKYLILDLLAERPRHGYDIIRALGERFGGFYFPSPGAVYPVLQALEAAGYIVLRRENGRKVYALTDAGQRFLEDHKETVSAVRERVQALCAAVTGPELLPALRQLRDIARYLIWQHFKKNLQSEKLRQVEAVLAEAQRQIRSISEGGSLDG